MADFRVFVLPAIVVLCLAASVRGHPDGVGRNYLAETQFKRITMPYKRISVRQPDRGETNQRPYHRLSSIFENIHGARYVEVRNDSQERRGRRIYGKNKQWRRRSHSGGARNKHTRIPCRIQEVATNVTVERSCGEGYACSSGPRAWPRYSTEWVGYFCSRVDTEIENSARELKDLFPGIHVHDPASMATTDDHGLY